MFACVRACDSAIHTCIPRFAPPPPPPLLACACRPLLTAARTIAPTSAALGAHRFAALRSARSSRCPRRCAPRRVLRRFALAGRAGGCRLCVRPTPRRRLASCLPLAFIKLVGVGCRRLPRPVLVLSRALYAPQAAQGRLQALSGTKRHLILYNRGSAPINGGFAALQNCRFV